MDKTHIDFEALLRKRDIRPTSTRILICRLLSRMESPLSAAEIENRLDTVDRSTVGRTVATLAEGGLLHKIDDGSGVMKYELCHANDAHHEGMHSDMHPHFYCRNCGRTICMTDIPMPTTELSQGFEIESINLVFSGICADCNRSR